MKWMSTFIINKLKINNNKTALTNDPNNLSLGLTSCVISSEKPKIKTGVKTISSKIMRYLSWSEKKKLIMDIKINVKNITKPPNLGTLSWWTVWGPSGFLINLLRLGYNVFIAINDKKIVNKNGTKLCNKIECNKKYSKNL